MEVRITKLNGCTPWIEGVAGGYVFQAKVMDNSSSCGINEGRVIKLAIYHEKEQGGKCFIVNYDRGWDISPGTEEQREVYRVVMELLEERSK